jgi:hypothetical protein
MGGALSLCMWAMREGIFGGGGVIVGLENNTWISGEWGR